MESMERERERDKHVIFGLVGKITIVWKTLGGPGYITLHFLDHVRGPLAWAKVGKLFVVLSIYKTTISIDW